MGVTAGNLATTRGAFTLEVTAFEAGVSGTAVLGPNGAGKTTLLLALQGLLPSSGVIRRPGRCAAVFARPAVLRGTTAWNVAVIVRDVLGTNAADANARALTALGDVGLAGVASADARTLSTGQRQRLALARALACEPEALFLDEPFANLDADARPLLRAAIAAYVKRTACTVVIATSSLADAMSLCGHAIVLEGGHVTHAGSTGTLRSAKSTYVDALYAEVSLPLTR